VKSECLKRWGLGPGFVAVQGLNVVSVNCLFHSGQWNVFNQAASDEQNPCYWRRVA
jgi:hypothetical protein